MPHAHYRNYQHIVFATKGRRRSLQLEIRTIAYDSIRKTCRDYGVAILEMNGPEDHVHLLLNIPPKHSVANIVRAIKGGSSMLLNEQKHLFAWQEGYSAFSVSESNVAAVRQYICAQQVHHQKQSFDSEFLALLRKHGIAITKEPCPPGEVESPIFHSHR